MLNVDECKTLSVQLKCKPVNVKKCKYVCLEMQVLNVKKCKSLNVAPGVMGDSDINQLKDAEFKEAFDEFDTVILD